MQARRRHALARGSAPPDAWGRIGAILHDRLQLGRVIGYGPHGTVYAGEELVTGRTVAVKVLRTKLADAELPLGDGDREVMLAPALGHRGLVEAESLGRLSDGSLFLVHELVAGVDLGRVVDDGALPEERALRVIHRALDGLEALHRAGHAHGNLKPENLISVGIGRAHELDDEPVRILDLALARLLRRGAATMVAASGGPYIAPEVSATRVATQRGDVYALGVVLAELLGFERGRARPAISRDTEFALWRAVQPEARDRYRDATEMRCGLETAIRALA
jgi:serine/threonine protein kinase